MVATTSFFDTMRVGLNAPERTKESQKWFANKVRSLNGKIQSATFLRDPHFIRKTAFKPGFMYHFIYDAKTKDTLPYWDKFPLIVAVKPADAGFYGLNLHYLHPMLRARLLDRLMKNTNNDAWDETTKMRINYNMLTATAALKYFKPCFKHYLFENISSRIMMVPSSEWEIAMFLPTEKFTGANKNKVWMESKKSVMGR